MTRLGPSSEPPRLAVRCDGGAAIGAGHVARCVPLARAVADRGWDIAFVGRYDGLAAYLLDDSRMRTEPPTDDPCGLDAEHWDAAIVDLYGVARDAICGLAHELPIATLGEASRCPDRGVVVDYHLDRTGTPDDARLVAGPEYAPLDPAFAAAGRARASQHPGGDVRTVLIAVGGSEPARAHLPALRALAERCFPGAELLDPGAGSGRPVRLVDLVAGVDVAITAAGFTAYELACAGVPMVAIGIVANQRRVVSGLRRAKLAPAVDLSCGERVEELAPELDRLRDGETRVALGRRGRELFDGGGAARAADALIERWTAASLPVHGQFVR